MNIHEHIRSEIERQGKKKTKICQKNGIDLSKFSKFTRSRGGLWPVELMDVLHELGFKVIHPLGHEIFPENIKHPATKSSEIAPVNQSTNQPTT